MLLTTTYFFAGTYGNGVYRAVTDNWVPVNLGLNGPARYVNDFARTDSIIYVATNNGLFKTTDFGDQWLFSGSGLPDAPVLAVHYLDGVLYAGMLRSDGTLPGGVYRSTDLGTSWDHTSFGLDTRYPMTQFASFTDLLVVGTGGDGTYFTTDTGATWNSVHGGLPNNGYVYITELFTSQGKAFAGVLGDGLYAINLGGGGWYNSSTGLNDPDIYAMARILNRLYAGTETGVYVSTDDGQLWNFAIDDSLRNRRIGALIDDGIGLLAGTYGGGVFRYTSPQSGWSWFNKGMKASIILEFYTRDPYDGYIYASVFGNGIYRYETSSGKWENYTPNMKGFALEVNEFIPSVDTVYIATNDGMWYSANEGQSWAVYGISQPTGNLPRRGMKDLIITDSAMFAIATQQLVYRSTTGGVFWHEFRHGLPTPPGGVPLNTNDAEYINGSIYLAMDSTFLFQLAPNANSWQSIPYTGLGLTQIVELDGYDSVMYAAGLGGVYISLDSGYTWMPDTLGVGPRYIREFKLAQKTQFGNHYHAHLVTVNGAVFIQDSMRGPWRYIPVDHSQTMTFLNDQTHTYIGTYGRGVQRTDVIPVELSAFTAAALDDERVQLVWMTETETGNAGFEIQRSRDAKEFEAIAFIEGAGSTTETQRYSYIDEAPGTVFYRLKQIDFSGEWQYSNTVKVGRDAAWQLQRVPSRRVYLSVKGELRCGRCGVP